jgi:hypothetical protein
MGVVAPFVIRTPDQEPDRPAHAQGKDVVRSVDHSGQPPGKARGVYGQPRGRFYTVVWLNCVRRPKSRRRHWSIPRRLAYRSVDHCAQGESHPGSAPGRREPIGSAGRIRADRHLCGIGVFGVGPITRRQRLQGLVQHRDVISGGIAAGIACSQQPKRFRSGLCGLDLALPVCKRPAGQTSAARPLSRFQSRM